MLAARIGVALKFAEYPSPPKVVEALASGAADMALLGIDPVRGIEVDFSPPLLAADFTYLVPEGSAVRAIADADRTGVRIALAVKKGEAGWHSYVSGFAEAARADGTVERAIAGAGLGGVETANR